MARVNTLAPSAARTASGSALVSFSDTGNRALRAQLEVTAASGTTPTLDVVVEDSLDGTNWNAVATFAQRTTTGREVLNVQTPFHGQMRVRWTIAGTTPSFTFSVLATLIGE